MFFRKKGCGKRDKKTYRVGRTGGSDKIASPKAALTAGKDRKEATAIKNAADLFPQTFSALCSLSLSLDKGEVLQGDISGRISVLLANAETAHGALPDTAGAPAAGVGALIGILSDLKNSRQDSSDLKMSAFKVFFCYDNFKRLVS